MLESAGVPLGAIRAPHRVDDTLLRAALDVVASDLHTLAPTERLALLAWLAAFHHHWPVRFRESLGEAGNRLLADLHRRPFDANHYLKLRRIAVDNLAPRAVQR